MDKIILKSPAKVNLFLNVLGKRPDGYHRIETIFARIDLCDRIVLKKKTSGIKLLCGKADLPNDERNLAYKAASLLFEKVDKSVGVTIEIEKKIPISAGLGGGSSNAASVLLGLNKLFDFGLSMEELLELSRSLGADVAFFIHEVSFAKGSFRGDIITPIDSQADFWQVLVVPPFGLSTKDIYESLETYPKEATHEIDRVTKALDNNNLTDSTNLLYNRLEEVVLARYLEIGQVKEDLIDLGAKGALVSGSGPTIFGLTKTRKEAVEIEKKLKKGILASKKQWQVYVLHTI